jgi:hypothetical protein
MVFTFSSTEASHSVILSTSAQKPDTIEFSRYYDMRMQISSSAIFYLVFSWWKIFAKLALLVDVNIMGIAIIFD